MLDEDAWCKNRIQNESSSNEETRHQEAEGRLDLQEKKERLILMDFPFTKPFKIVLQTVSPFRNFQKN